MAKKRWPLDSFFSSPSSPVLFCSTGNVLAQLDWLWDFLEEWIRKGKCAGVSFFNALYWGESLTQQMHSYVLGITFRCYILLDGWTLVLKSVGFVDLTSCGFVECRKCESAVFSLVSLGGRQSSHVHKILKCFTSTYVQTLENIYCAVSIS